MATEKEQESIQKNVVEEVEEVYAEIIKEEEEEAKEHKKKALGRAIELIRSVWIVVFDYSIPVILRDNPKYPQLIVALFLGQIGYMAICLALCGFMSFLARLIWPSLARRAQEQVRLILEIEGVRDKVRLEMRTVVPG